MRDFRGALCHTVACDDQVADEIYLGMQLLSSAMRGLPVSAAKDQVAEPPVRKRQRLAPFDLGIALENMLQQMGMTLRFFSSGPQHKPRSAEHLLRSFL